jgi:hypothetical protein
MLMAVHVNQNQERRRQMYMTLAIPASDVHDQSIHSVPNNSKHEKIAQFGAHVLFSYSPF